MSWRAPPWRDWDTYKQSSRLVWITKYRNYHYSYWARNDKRHSNARTRMRRRNSVSLLVSFSKRRRSPTTSSGAGIKKKAWIISQSRKFLSAFWNQDGIVWPPCRLLSHRHDTANRWMGVKTRAALQYGNLKMIFLKYGWYRRIL